MNIFPKISPGSWSISMPAAILLSALILGGTLYGIQYSKQRSIERQQQTELKVKNEKEDRTYIAKRKMECYEIYEKERKQWSNVENFGYIEPSDNAFSLHSDTCEIIYEDDKAGTYFRKYY